MNTTCNAAHELAQGHLIRPRLYSRHGSPFCFSAGSSSGIFSIFAQSHIHQQQEKNLALSPNNMPTTWPRTHDAIGSSDDQRHSNRAKHGWLQLKDLRQHRRAGPAARADQHSRRHHRCRHHARRRARRDARRRREPNRSSSGTGRSSALGGGSEGGVVMPMSAAAALVATGPGNSCG